MKNFWKDKKVLVTGGAGFIGSNMVRELVRRGSLVTITVFKSSLNKDLNSTFSNIIKKIKIEKVDLLFQEDCLRITKNVDIVLNFAALDGGAKYKKEYAKQIYMVNTGIVKNILEASRLNNVDRVLLMSSVEVYPKGIKHLFSEDDADMNIKKGYEGSKVFSEKLAKKYYEKYRLKIAIARPGNIYGPGDIANSERARIIPTFINKALNNEAIEIVNTQKLSFLYIKDLNNALLNLVEKYAVCDPVNLASTQNIYLKTIAELIIKLTHSKSSLSVKHIMGNKRIINIKKAQRVIKFNEETTFIDGLGSLI